MLRKHRKRLGKKPAAKNPKRKNNEESSRNASNSPANSSTTSDLNFTLPEGRQWDSFDIFRANEEK